MTREYHIDCSELKHFDEYEEEWMENYPGQSCAICVCIPSLKDIEKEGKYLDSWRQLYWQDLLALGLPTGTNVWIGID